MRIGKVRAGAFGAPVAVISPGVARPGRMWSGQWAPQHDWRS